MGGEVTHSIIQSLMLLVIELNSSWPWLHFCKAATTRKQTKNNVRRQKGKKNSTGKTSFPDEILPVPLIKTILERSMLVNPPSLAAFVHAPAIPALIAAG